MPLTTEKKKGIFTQYAGKDANTGSIEGQIAMITERMAQIAAHQQTNKKDFSTRLSLLKLVGKRRRLLNYLFKNDIARYRAIIAELGIRK